MIGKAHLTSKFSQAPFSKEPPTQSLQAAEFIEWYGQASFLPASRPTVDSVQFESWQTVLQGVQKNPITMLQLQGKKLSSQHTTPKIPKGKTYQ